MALDCPQFSALLPSGFSGAELSNVVNEAAFLAARSSGEAVGLPELVEAVQRTRWVPGWLS
jgi:ATP-dependent Zn protease